MNLLPTLEYIPILFVFSGSLYNEYTSYMIMINIFSENHKEGEIMSETLHPAQSMAPCPPHVSHFLKI